MNSEQTLLAQGLYKSGFINKSMLDYVESVISIGASEKFFNEALFDAQRASLLGVKSYEDLTHFFFIRGEANRLSKEFGLGDFEESPFISFALSKNIGLDRDNLGAALIEWACIKKAYPNVSWSMPRNEIYDISKWAKTIKNIYLIENVYGLPREDALKQATADWDSDELFKFKIWVGYYEAGNTEKYNVKTSSLTIFKKAFIPEVNPGERSNVFPQFGGLIPAKPVEVKPDPKEKAAAFKSKMKSRLSALKRFVDKYNDLLPHQNLAAIYDEIHKLDVSISQLNAYATMRNCVIRSAGRMEKFGFDQGSDFLKKAADLVDPNQPASPAETKPTSGTQAVIVRLESLSKVFKSRDVIRELASIDIALNELGIASHFPEITDSQSKLIEAFGYSSNKIESVIAKLRGGGASGAPGKSVSQQPAPVKPQLDTQELTEKPMAPAQQVLPTK